MPFYINFDLAHQSIIRENDDYIERGETQLEKKQTSPQYLDHPKNSTTTTEIVEGPEGAIARIS